MLEALLDRLNRDATDGARFMWVCCGKRSAFGYCSFCAHHPYEGAEVIFIFLDKHDVEVIGALETLPQTKVIPTDNAYWSSKGARPENI